MRKYYNNYVVQLIREKNKFVNNLILQNDYKKEFIKDYYCNNIDISLLSEFFDICDSLKVTPKEFFEKSVKYPDLFEDIITELVLSILSKLNDKIK